MSWTNIGAYLYEMEAIVCMLHKELITKLCGNQTILIIKLTH